MSAATVNDAKVTGNGFLAGLIKVQNAVSNNPNKLLGLYFVEVTSGTIATTSIDDANDEYFVCKFPANCRLVALQYKSTDRDTNATPLLVEDIIVENSAGTEVVLINNTAAGQGGTSDELDLGGGLIGMDVSGMKLGQKVVDAAATGATGTVTYRMIIAVGKDRNGVVKF